jgi:L-alanine-DL-glutamate epimerase-like enolase superfamily enzyme
MQRLDRRQFIKRIGLGSIIASAYNSFLIGILSCHKKNMQEKIENIELFRFDVDVPRHFSFGTWHSRQHAILNISIGELSGWSERRASHNNPNLNISVWGSFLEELKGQTVSEAFEYIKNKRDGEGKWHWSMIEFVEMALLDLAGRLLKKPAIELLGLKSKGFVPGLFCILEEDPEKAKEQARLSLKHNLKTHIKVKIFGDENLDVRLVSSVRGIMGPSAYIVADANRGYKSWNNLDDLANKLLNLYDQGLNACEDPAQLTNKQWVTLQNKVGDLTLIPDYPMRPVWEAINNVLPGMGRIYNLHPASMGSFFDAVKMGHQIQKWGHNIMIGDDSLVGPACTAWQQIAIGLGASWVEALEKPKESHNFLPCVISQATYRDEDGRYGLKPDIPGFGLELDKAILKEKSKDYFQI